MSYCPLVEDSKHHTPSTVSSTATAKLGPHEKRWGKNEDRLLDNTVKWRDGDQLLHSFRGHLLSRAPPSCVEKLSKLALMAIRTPERRQELPVVLGANLFLRLTWYLHCLVSGPVEALSILGSF